VLLVGGLMLTQTIGWGTTFSQVGILAGPIAGDLGLSRGTIFLGGTILYLFASATAAPAGRLADHLGGLKLLIPGSLGLAFGIWLLSRSAGSVSYLLPWAICGMAMHVGLVTAAYTALAQVLGKKSVRAISTLTLATGLCSTIFWPLSEFLLFHIDWRGVLLCYAAATLLLCAPVHLLLYLRFGHLRAGESTDAPEPAIPHIIPTAEVSGQRLMITVACIGSLLGVGFGIAAIEIFVALGTPRLEAVYAGSLTGIAFIASRGLATVLADRLSPIRLAQITYLALPLGLSPLLYFALTGTNLPGWTAAGVAFAFGMPAGMVGYLRSVMPLYLFGSDGYGTRLGIQARLTELASAAAPIGFSWALGVSATGLLGGLVFLGGGALWGTLRLSRLVRPACVKQTS
jgi:MFS family permease